MAKTTFLLTLTKITRDSKYKKFSKYISLMSRVSEQDKDPTLRTLMINYLFFFIAFRFHLNKTCRAKRNSIHHDQQILAVQLRFNFYSKTTKQQTKKIKNMLCNMTVTPCIGQTLHHTTPKYASQPNIAQTLH